MIPVVLFAYARPALLRRTLDCLRENGVPKIYAFSDAPKTIDRANAVAEVRRMLRAVDWCDISIVERPTNLGLGVAIRSGVGSVLEQHDAAIVFEDDLICVPGTYTYLASALEHYKNDPRVMSVTGWTHPRITPTRLNIAPYFDGRSECLGWATWARVWHGMEDDARVLIRQCEERGIDPYRYGADLVEMAEAEHARNIWAVRFLYLHIANRGLCLRPPHSLIEHIGFGPDATNATEPGGWENPPLKHCPPIPSPWPEPIEHPDCQPLSTAVYGGRPVEPSRVDRVRTTVTGVARTAARPLKRIARNFLPAKTRMALRRVLCRETPLPSRKIVEVLTVPPTVSLECGWQDAAIPARQHAALGPHLEAMRDGRPRADFSALASAVAAAAVTDPCIVEVGCGTAFNFEVLSSLIAQRFHYVGIDYAQPMVAFGRACYPNGRFIIGDATRLPLRDASCDVLVSGTVLMHLLGYGQAIEESRRVTRRWCIFHTVPATTQRETTILTKAAYGSRVVEILLNERELLEIFGRVGLSIRRTFDNIRHEYLDDVAGEPVTAKTYLCEKH
jgi:SAM-dependent methyltransferase